MRLRRTEFPTMRAATGENLTTRSRGHAGTKAVRALSMQVARLVRTLHGGISRGRFFLESSAKTSTWWGGTKGGKGTQHFPECQACSGLRRPAAVRNFARPGCG